ncbi:MAG: YkgJ family cysteine cluster protein [Candidatus Caldatribacteriota bacterium]
MNEYLKQLHQKILEHHQKVETNYPQGMTCKNGCSRCCYVDLSVFSLEAQFIKDWFQALSAEKKAELKVLWEQETSYQENFFGQNVAACPFLKNESCSIYEARPVICRTQGLPLKFNNEGGASVDTCPLNFNEDELVIDDCLDLDRLNLILATLQRQRGDEERLSLNELLNELKRLV